MRFALVRLTAASVSKPNSFLTPIVCYKGLCLLNKNRKNSNTIGIGFLNRLISYQNHFYELDFFSFIRVKIDKDHSFLQSIKNELSSFT
ncbi:MAG: hypothetical protein OXB86_02225 [Bdellovibrionales bacterium]|nr:hypothetical protein [Bdellovibrionales bacterium]